MGPLNKEEEPKIEFGKKKTKMLHQSSRNIKEMEWDDEKNINEEKRVKVMEQDLLRS